MVKQEKSPITRQVYQGIIFQIILMKRDGDGDNCSRTKDKDVCFCHKYHIIWKKKMPYMTKFSSENGWFSSSVVCIWPAVARSSVIVRFVLTKWEAPIGPFDQIRGSYWPIWSKQNGRWLMNVLQKDSEFLDLLNHYLFKEIGHGIMHQLNWRWYTALHVKEQFGISEPQPLGYENVIFTFACLGIGMSTSLSIAMVELIVMKFHYRW